MNKTLAKKNIACISLIVLVWALFYWPLIAHVNYAIGDDDWYQNYYFADTFRKIVLEYHQFPFRSPFMSGGYPVLGFPYDPTLNPFLAMPILVLGSVPAINISGLLLSLLGALGMFYLTKDVLRYSYLGAIFSTLIFMLTKWGLNFISEGNYAVLYFWLLPWLAAAFIKSIHNKKFIIISAAILSIYLVQTGLTFIPITIFLFLFTCFKSLRLMEARKITVSNGYLISFLLVLILAFCLSAVKLIPMNELLNQRLGYIHLPGEDSYAAISHFSSASQKSLNWGMLVQTLIDRNFYNLAHAAYFGYLPLLISILAFLIYPLQTVIWVFFLAIFIFIEMGSNAPVDIFRLIWHIHPAVHGVWRLTKYFSFFIIFLIPIIGGRFFSLPHKIFKKTKWFTLSAVILIFISACNMFVANRIYYRTEISYNPIPVFKRQNDFFQIKIEERYRDDNTTDIRALRPIWYLLRQNIGMVSFSNLVNMPIAEAAIPKFIVGTAVIPYKVSEKTAIPVYELDKNIYRGIFEDRSDLLPAKYKNPAYKGEVFFLNSCNKATLKYFSPNKIYIDVEVDSPDILIINQNYHKDWRSAKGEIVNYNGLLGVRLGVRGNFLIQLNYTPLSFYIGLAISMATLMYSLVYLFFAKREKKA